MAREKQRYRYSDYSWDELKELVPRQPVVIQPIGSVEDHGRHLPLDTDNFLIESICAAAAEQAPEEILLLPTIPYGFEDHHMEFPGTVTIRVEHLLEFVLDVTKSVAHHGFRKILIADGHGSNMPILDLVARRTVTETEALCATFIWPSLIREVAREVRESEFPGGMAHACELETSVYLYLNAERVRMEKAIKEIGFQQSRWIWQDLVHGSPVLMMDWWSRQSKSGTVGDPTLASAEKGRRLFEATVAALVDLARDFREMEIRPREDMH